MLYVILKLYSGLNHERWTYNIIPYYLLSRKPQRIYWRCDLVERLAPLWSHCNLHLFHHCSYLYSTSYPKFIQSTYGISSKLHLNRFSQRWVRGSLGSDWNKKFSRVVDETRQDIIDGTCSCWKRVENIGSNRTFRHRKREKDLSYGNPSWRGG